VKSEPTGSQIPQNTGFPCLKKDVERVRISARGEMKKIIYLALIIIVLLCCVHKQEKVERIIEDGVEVIVNHSEPYKIKGEPSTLHLEEEFTIDTGRDEIAEIGVTDIEDFDVDSQGNIYFFQKWESDENLVYKFDKNANFVTTFGKRGQGPGEIEYPLYQYITNQDEILIQDESKFKLFVFDRNGVLIEEACKDLKIKINRDPKTVYTSFSFIPLENGNYLAYGWRFDFSTKHRFDLLLLFNSKLEKLKELDKCDYGKTIAFSLRKVKYTPRVFICQVSDKRIYVGHENRGYEILIYDLDANLVKKIRKEYNPVDVPNEFKEFWRANIGRYEDRLDFPDNMPPFHYFFLDDEGRLYVKTYEKGDKQNEYIHDIFNSDGIFIARESIAGYGGWVYPGITLNRAKARNNRIYCIREKENGYKELIVYGMKWE